MQNAAYLAVGGASIKWLVHSELLLLNGAEIAPVRANGVNRWKSVGILGRLWFAIRAGHSLNGTQIFMARY